MAQLSRKLCTREWAVTFDLDKDRASFFLKNSDLSQVTYYIMPLRRGRSPIALYNTGFPLKRYSASLGTVQRAFLVHHCIRIEGDLIWTTLAFQEKCCLLFRSLIITAYFASIPLTGFLFNRVTRFRPTLKAIAHPFNIAISVFNRYDAGLVRFPAIRSIAVKYQVRFFVLRKLRHI